MFLELKFWCCDKVFIISLSSSAFYLPETFDISMLRTRYVLSSDAMTVAPSLCYNIEKADVNLLICLY